MALPSLKLVSFTLCPYVQRALIVLLEKNLEHEVEYIDLSSPPPWFFDISPLEKVPVLLVNDQPLFESIPIMEFIDEISPGSLYPEDPFDKAQQKAWMEFANQTLSDTYNFYTSSDELIYKQKRNIILDRLDTVEEILGDGPYFCGSQFSMVDVVYATLFRYLDHLGKLANEDYFDETPLVKQWCQQLLQRNSIQKSVPETYDTEMKQMIKSQDSVFSKKFLAH